MELLSIASYAPSACNLQAWNFIVIDDDELKKKVVTEGKVNKQVLKAPVFIVATYNKHVTREHFANYQSCAAAIQNFLLISHAEGIGTLWLCNFKNESGIKRVLTIPDTHKVLAIIEVGYPSETPKTPKRNPVEDFVSFNKFSSEKIIPQTTFLDNWKWDDVLHWQQRFARRGYALEKVTDAEKKEIPKLIIPMLDNEPCFELFTQSGSLSIALNNYGTTIDYHFSSQEIYDAAKNFEPSLEKSAVLISEHIDRNILGSYNNYLLINKSEHMPSKTFELLIEILSGCKNGTKLIILFRNKYSWFGLYDFVFRRLFKKNGIDDIFFGSLRNLGPWKLRSRGWIRRIMRKYGFKIIKTHGLFCLPGYRFSNSEWVNSKKKYFLIFKLLYSTCAIMEFLLRFTGLSRYIGEQILFVCRLENND